MGGGEDHLLKVDDLGGGLFTWGAWGLVSVLPRKYEVLCVGWSNNGRRLHQCNVSGSLDGPGAHHADDNRLSGLGNSCL